MMRTQHRKTLGRILLILCIIVCLFLAGCKDKSIDHYNQGLDYYNKGEYEHAIAEFTKAIEINSRDAEAYLKRGNAYDHIGEHDLAISEFTKAIEIDPRDAEAYLKRGNAYHLKGEYNKAWVDVHKAQSLGLEVHPGFLKAEELQEQAGKFLNDNEQSYYVSKGHNFKVRFPGKVNVTDYGMITHYTTKIKGEAAYNVFVNTYPKPVVSDVAINAALRGYVVGRLTLLGDKAKLIESRHIYFRGCKAWEYEYTIEAEGTIGYFKGTCLVVGKLGYNINVVCAEETKVVAYAKYGEFAKSFHLTKRR